MNSKNTKEIENSTFYPKPRLKFSELPKEFALKFNSVHIKPKYSTHNQLNFIKIKENNEINKHIVIIKITNLYEKAYQSLDFSLIELVFVVFYNFDLLYLRQIHINKNSKILAKVQNEIKIWKLFEVEAKAQARFNFNELLINDSSDNKIDMYTKYNSTNSIFNYFKINNYISKELLIQLLFEGISFLESYHKITKKEYKAIRPSNIFFNQNIKITNQLENIYIFDNNIFLIMDNEGINNSSKHMNDPCCNILVKQDIRKRLIKKIHKDKQNHENNFSFNDTEVKITKYVSDYNSKGKNVKAPQDNNILFLDYFDLGLTILYLSSNSLFDRCFNLSSYQCNHKSMEDNKKFICCCLFHCLEYESIHKSNYNLRAVLISIQLLLGQDIIKLLCHLLSLHERVIKSKDKFLKSEYEYDFIEEISNNDIFLSYANIIANKESYLLDYLLVNKQLLKNNKPVELKENQIDQFYLSFDKNILQISSIIASKLNEQSREEYLRSLELTNYLSEQYNIPIDDISSKLLEILSKHESNFN